MSTLSVDTIQGKTTAGTVAMPEGMVVQVKETTTTSTISTTSTSVVASGLIVSITPKFQSSKFVVIFNGNSDYHTGAGHSIYGYMYRKIGSGSYADQGTILRQLYGSSFGLSQYGKIVDSPNTTSELSYQLYSKSSNGNGVYINAYGGLAVLQVMEIKQ